jgi:hypothetical protein
MTKNVFSLKPAFIRLAVMCVFMLSCGLAAAQTPAAETKAQDQAAAAPAPAANGEGFRVGAYEGHSEFEVGYRWVTGAGNRDMYRTMVNLGEGPKVLQSRFSLRSNYGTGVLFDQLDVSFNNWGGEPYNTMRFNIGRSDVYEFRADYRNLNYFNQIPFFANPRMTDTGEVVRNDPLTFFSQHARNVTFRTTDLELKLFPNRKIRPYVGYSRNTGFGPAFTTFSVTGNEFNLLSDWHYSSDYYRGGVELSLPRLDLTLEQGWRLLKNDTGVQNTADVFGNNPVPFLGQPIVLQSMQRGYHDRTTMPVSRAIVKFSPWDALRLTGRYVYSMASLESDFFENRAGGFVTLDDRLFYSAAVDNFDGRAKEPNHYGSFLVEFEPFSRLSVIDQFDNRNFHVSGSTLLATLFLNARALSGQPGVSDVSVQSALAELFSFDQVRNLAEVEFAIARGFSARAGHQYTFSEVSKRKADEDVLSTFDATQQTGLFGVAYRRGQWLHLALDYEKTISNRVLMRTDLLDFDRFRFDWRLGRWRNIYANGRVAFLRNRNDDDGIDLRGHNRDYTVAITYEPSERFNATVDYTRSNILSDLLILLPARLQIDRSIFDERTDSIGGALGVGVYRGARIDFGYRGIHNFGNLPLQYHQPFASVTIPFHNRLSLRTHWQYFGYNEKLTPGFDDHRTHLVTLSLAYSY